VLVRANTGLGRPGAEPWFTDTLLADSPGRADDETGSLSKGPRRLVPAAGCNWLTGAAARIRMIRYGTLRNGNIK
jgi:hypothetical protein